jgi:plastocyanin
MTTTEMEKAGDGEPDREGGPGTDIVPAGDAAGGGPPPPHTALLDPSENPRAEAIRTRIWLPLLLPILSGAALFFYVINLSRALLAGGEWGSLVIASIITLSILGGAAWISSQPNLRTSTLGVILAGLLLLIGAMGLTSVGPSLPKHVAAGGPKAPKGDAVATVEVDALPTLKFQSTNFTTQAGINEIKYVLVGGTHTLAFREKELSYFGLAVDSKQPEDTGKVDLKPGTYNIYCTIPGHAAAGMEATITVS